MILKFNAEEQCIHLDSIPVSGHVTTSSDSDCTHITAHGTIAFEYANQ
jgi:hypothetical protein